MPSQDLRTLLSSLRPPKSVSSFLARNNTDLRELSREYDVPVRYLQVQTLLLIPKYSIEQINSRPAETFSGMRPILSALSKSYRQSYDLLYEKSNFKAVKDNSRIKGRKQLQVAHSSGERIALSFREVDFNSDCLIQNKLHYIGSAREDQIISTGLFLEGASAPFAYVSFSRAARSYQICALNAAKKTNFSRDEVIVMARAFTLDNSPLNTMSKLFHLAHELIRDKYPERKISITAINPFLGFSGSSYVGSSYYPYALSPMQYRYDKSGFYTPRSKGLYSQKIETPDIVWLSRGLNSDSTKTIEREKYIVKIPKIEYELG